MRTLRLRNPATGRATFRAREPTGAMRICSHCCGSPSRQFAATARLKQVLEAS
jgi:hypothetical protein